MVRYSARLRGKVQLSESEVKDENEIHKADESLVIADVKESYIPVFEEEKMDTDESDGDLDVEALADSFADKYLNKIQASKSENFIQLPGKNFNKFEGKTVKDKLPTAIDITGISTEGYININAQPKQNDKINELYSTSTNDKDSVMKNSVITPDFETKHRVLNNRHVSLNSQKKQRRKERASTAGKNWFHMKAPEMTEEKKNDLKILQMRSVLDPKRFYKHNDRKKFPKFFQMGKVMDSAADYYSSRVPKKQRKQTLAEELLADANFKKYQKRKYNELQAKRKALGGIRHIKNKKKKKSKH